MIVFYLIVLMYEVTHLKMKAYCQMILFYARG